MLNLKSSLKKSWLHSRNQLKIHIKDLAWKHQNGKPHKHCCRCSGWTIRTILCEGSCKLQNRGTVSAYLGKIGGFERNHHAVLSGIYKSHIRIPGVDDPWLKTTPIHRRVSDNFLIFAVHNTYPIHIQIIAIIKPDGHEKVKNYCQPSLI